MVWVTHDLEEAGRSSDRVAVLLGGGVAQVGTPEDVFRHPESAAVARFLGLPNELPGVVEAGRLVLLGRPVHGYGPSAPYTVPAYLPGGVTVIFGAEGARLVPPGEGDLPACVLDVHHHPQGATVRVRLAVTPTGGPEGPADAFTCEISAGAQRAPRRGRTVGLALDPRHLHAFPVEDARASTPAGLRPGNTPTPTR